LLIQGGESMLRMSGTPLYILRNEVYSHARRPWRETRWDADLGEHIPGPACEQEWAMELCDTAQALGELPESQRKALILIAAGGFSYEDAAQISGIPAGTVKSRVARARRRAEDSRG
jgi:RNA polymerase sigma-70 factor (ECF subfamily)